MFTGSRVGHRQTKRGAQTRLGRFALHRAANVGQRAIAVGQLQRDVLRGQLDPLPVMAVAQLTHEQSVQRVEMRAADERRMRQPNAHCGVAGFDLDERETRQQPAGVEIAQLEPLIK